MGLTLAVAPASLLLAQTAQAFSFYQFQSPSGNIFCGVGVLDNGKAFAECEVIDRAWSPPPPPRVCEGEWGDRIGLDQGRPAAFECHGDTLFGAELPTWGYGQTWSAGPITCLSQPSGMTCTDNSTGHFFAVSRESYDLR